MANWLKQDVGGSDLISSVKNALDADVKSLDLVVQGLVQNYEQSKADIGASVSEISSDIEKINEKVVSIINKGQNTAASVDALKLKQVSDYESLIEHVKKCKQHTVDMAVDISMDIAALKVNLNNNADSIKKVEEKVDANIVELKSINDSSFQKNQQLITELGINLLEIRKDIENVKNTIWNVIAGGIIVSVLLIISIVVWG